MFYVKPSASVSCSFRFFFFCIFIVFKPFAIITSECLCVCECVDATVCSFLKLGLGLGLCLLTEAAELSRLVGATKFSLDIVQ